MAYREQDIEAAIERDAIAWAECFGVTDPEHIESRRRVQRANVAVGFFDPLLRVGLVDALADECHGYDLDGNPVDPNFSLADEITGSFEVDGEPIDDLKAFLADNDFDEDILLTMSILRPGDSMHLGGGAAPLVTLKRIG